MSVEPGIGYSDTGNITSCIKHIVGSVPPDVLVKLQKRIVKQVVKFLSETMEDGQKYGFLLEGKPRREYEEYCNMFNQFITGPAAEGREIAELTDKYQKFYEVINTMKLEVQESNKIEYVLYDVAIEAEMQGFIYGFKLLDAFINGQLAMILNGLDCM